MDKKRRTNEQKQPKRKELFITTIDNPFDYFTQFDEWYEYDRLKGYNTLEYLGRITKTSSELSDEENNLEIESAIDSIIEWNGSMYKKIYSNN